MSYSLSRKCGSCTKKIRCLDSSFIMGAISGIHQMNYQDAQRQAHLGGGTITIDCCNFDDENKLSKTICAICNQEICICHL